MNCGRLLKLIKLGANVLYLNLLGFLLAFSILSQSPGLLNMQGGGDYDQGSRDVAGVTKLTQHARPTWITTSLTDKTSTSLRMVLLVPSLSTSGQPGSPELPPGSKTLV